MKRMYSIEELKKFLEENGSFIVEALKNKDLSIAGLTSKGIANTGGFANIGDVAISGDLDVQGEGKGAITGNTLDIKNALYTLDFEATNLGGRTFTARYCKALVSAGVMYVIISAEIKNETAEAIASGNINVRIRNIPSEVGSKIVCVNGALVSDETGGNPQICGITFRRGNTFSNIANQYLFKGTQNGIDINLQVSSLNADASEQVEGRTFICLF